MKAPHKSHYIYILECADNTLYVGSTNDLNKRLHQHNNSKNGAHYTKIRRPVKLVYSERVRTLTKARAREAEIKRWDRKKKLDFIHTRTNQSKNVV
ncbi:MAG: GIY-YIG nuclease family protein [Candidatus Taylorbacteria bacterium]